MRYLRCLPVLAAALLLPASYAGAKNVSRDVSFRATGATPPLTVAGRIKSGAANDALNYFASGSTVAHVGFGGELTAAFSQQQLLNGRIDFYFADAGQHNRLSTGLFTPADQMFATKSYFSRGSDFLAPGVYASEFDLSATDPSHDSQIGRRHDASGQTSFHLGPAPWGDIDHDATTTITQRTSFEVDALAIDLTFTNRNQPDDTFKEAFQIHAPQSSLDSCGASSPDYSCVWEPVAFPHHGVWDVDVEASIPVGAYSGSSTLEAAGSGKATTDTPFGTITWVDASFDEVSAARAVNFGEAPFPTQHVSSFVIAAVPEQGTMSLALTGLLALGALLRRRDAKAVSPLDPAP